MKTIKLSLAKEKTINKRFDEAYKNFLIAKGFMILRKSNQRL